MKLGTIVQAKYFNGVADPEESSKYQSLLKGNFSQVGMFAFGQMPFIAKGPDPEKDYDWKNTDALVEFGSSNSVEILYNTVINSQENSFPDWYKKLSPIDKEKALEKHVKTVVERYRGRIKIFKLVNEAFRFSEENFYGTNESRPALIAKIFSWAKEEYQEGVFMLNDHIPFLKNDELRIAYINLISSIKKAGAPIDVVGIEGHLGYRPTPFQLPPDDEINLALDEIHAAAKCPIHITEFDLSYNNDPVKNHPGSRIETNQSFFCQGVEYDNWFDYQAYAYKHFYNVCSTKNYVENLVFWGFRDDSKITWERPGTGFFNEDFSPKPVFRVMEPVLTKSK